MYITYNTESIIIDKKTKDKDAILKILTKDLGLVYAEAKGVLKQNAKLKHLIEPGSYSVISFIKGKNKWIIKGVFNHKKILKDYQIWQMVVKLTHIITPEQIDADLFNVLRDVILNDIDIYDAAIFVLAKQGYVNENDFKGLSLNDKRRKINNSLAQNHIYDVIL